MSEAELRASMGSMLDTNTEKAWSMYGRNPDFCTLFADSIDAETVGEYVASLQTQKSLFNASDQGRRPWMFPGSWKGVGTDRYQLCFGLTGCNAALDYYERNPDTADLSTMKSIAATHCTYNSAQCRKEARLYNDTIAARESAIGVGAFILNMTALGGPTLRSGYGPRPTITSAPRTGGATLVADDARSIRVADRAPVAAGEHNVVLHGDSNGFIGASVDEVAAAVRADPTYGGQRICLLSCNSASNGSAQALATDLGVPVRAPTGRVGLPQPPHAPVVTLDVGSEWQWFYPGGP